jgi:hypothetical protein
MTKEGSTKELDVIHTAAGESYHFVSRFTFDLVEKEDDNETQIHRIRYGNRLF